MDGIRSEFKRLGETKPQATRKAALLLGIKHTLPSVFEQLINRPDVGLEDKKRAIIISTTYMGIDVGTDKT